MSSVCLARLDDGSWSIRSWQACTNIGYSMRELGLGVWYPTLTYLPTKECATPKAWVPQRPLSSYCLAFIQAVLDRLFQGNGDLRQHAGMEAPGPEIPDRATNALPWDVSRETPGGHTVVGHGAVR